MNAITKVVLFLAEGCKRYLLPALAPGILKWKTIKHNQHMEGPVIQKRNTIMRIISFTWRSKEIIVEIISHLFIILFLYTGIAKLMEFDIFQEQLAESPLLEPIAAVITFGLPAVEFIVSLMLFFPRYRLKGLYASLFLMTAFTIYVIVLLNFSTQLPCSCGGIMEQLSWQGHLIFNSTCILLAFAAIRMQRKINRAKKLRKNP